MKIELNEVIDVQRFTFEQLDPGDFVIVMGRPDILYYVAMLDGKKKMIKMNKNQILNYEVRDDAAFVKCYNVCFSANY